MTDRDFWRNSPVVVLGAGSFGTVLASLAAPNCQKVGLWVRDPEDAKSINANHMNPKYVRSFKIHQKVQAVTDVNELFSWKPAAIIWALPSRVCRKVAREVAPLFHGQEILIHVTKGLEMGTLKRISEVLAEEIPCPRIGVLSGPNLAGELARGEPAAAVVASPFNEVVDAGQSIFSGPLFRVYGAKNMVAVEWAGSLKNILAIASGCLDGLGFGWNARALLITRGLAEMMRLSVAMGADRETFWGLSGIGDLIATCSSPLSRNYRVGQGLSQRKPLSQIVAEIGETAEGIATTEIVYEFARERNIDMPITEAVYDLLKGNKDIKDLFHSLMSRPSTQEF